MNQQSPLNSAMTRDRWVVVQRDKSGNSLKRVGPEYKTEGEAHENRRVLGGRRTDEQREAGITYSVERCQAFGTDMGKTRRNPQSFTHPPKRGSGLR